MRLSDAQHPDELPHETHIRAGKATRDAKAMALVKANPDTGVVLQAFPNPGAPVGVRLQNEHGVYVLPAVVVGTPRRPSPDSGVLVVDVEFSDGSRNVAPLVSLRAPAASPAPRTSARGEEDPGEALAQDDAARIATARALLAASPSGTSEALAAFDALAAESPQVILDRLLIVEQAAYSASAWAYDIRAFFADGQEQDAFVKAAFSDHSSSWPTSMGIAEAIRVPREYELNRRFRNGVAAVFDLRLEGLSRDLAGLRDQYAPSRSGEFRRRIERAWAGKFPDGTWMSALAFAFNTLGVKIPPKGPEDATLTRAFGQIAGGAEDQVGRQSPRLSRELAALKQILGWLRVVWPTAKPTDSGSLLIPLTGLPLKVRNGTWSVVDRMLVLRSGGPEPREASGQANSLEDVSDIAAMLIASLRGSGAPAPAPGGAAEAAAEVEVTPVGDGTFAHRTRYGVIASRDRMAAKLAEFAARVASTGVVSYAGLSDQERRWARNGRWFMVEGDDVAWVGGDFTIA